MSDDQNRDGDAPLKIELPPEVAGLAARDGRTLGLSAADYTIWAVDAMAVINRGGVSQDEEAKVTNPQAARYAIRFDADGLRAVDHASRCERGLATPCRECANAAGHDPNRPIQKAEAAGIVAHDGDEYVVNAVGLLVLGKQGMIRTATARRFPSDFRSDAPRVGS